MADITKCTGENCPIKHTCYRYTVPSGHWQAFNEFEYDHVNEICESYISQATQCLILHRQIYMSLDFYLESAEAERECKCECGHKHTKVSSEVLTHINITHNLTKMAEAVGVYKCLWRPDENNYIYARDIVEILKNGLNELESSPEKYKKYNPDNGWGDYGDLLEVVSVLLNACTLYPNAKITVSR